MEKFSNHEKILELKGGGCLEIPANQSITLEITIDKKTYLTGAEYFRQGNPEDVLSLKIKKNGEVLSTPANEIFLGNQGIYEFYQAVLNQSHTIEVVYKNNGEQPATFRFNLFLHHDK